MKKQIAMHISDRRSIISFIRRSVVLFFSCLSLIVLTSQIDDLHQPMGEYLGQLPPGNTPVRFAKNIIPDDLHSAPVFSRDGNRIYYKTLDGKGIMFMQYDDGKWKSAMPLFVNDEASNSDDPCINPMDNRLWFTSYNKDKNREFIYYCDKLKSHKCNTVQPAGMLNSLDLHWQFSIAMNGNVYFSSNGSIYCCVVEDGNYGDPYKLDENINSEYSECTPYISPDENLLIFSRSNGGKPDLFVSKRLKDGHWSAAKALGSGINSEHHEMCPQISPDGKYLFFLSSREGLFSAYWVSTKALEEDTDS